MHVTDLMTQQTWLQALKQQEAEGSKEGQVTGWGRRIVVAW